MERIRLPDLKLEAILGEIALYRSQMPMAIHRESCDLYAMGLVQLHYDRHNGQERLHEEALDHYKQRVEWFSLGG